jgi:hypothetical protein
MIVGELDKNYR